MTELPFTPLPITHPARTREYTKAAHTDVAATIAKYREEHAPILVCPIDGEDDE